MGREDMTDPLGAHVLFLNWRDTGHPEGGGSEVYVEQMARGLAQRGAHVTMLCPRYPGAAKRETVEGVDYRRIGGRLTIYLIVPLLALLRRLPRHDVVVEIQNGVPFLAAAYLKAPVIVLVHHIHREQWSIVYGAIGSRFGWWLESRLAPYVGRRNRYITVSEASSDELAELGVDKDRISVIHNGSPAHSDLVDAPRSATPELVVLGRLVPHKRVEIAMDVVRDLAPEFPEIGLTVVGEGWWHDTLAEYATEHGVTERVRFTGHVTDDEKHQHLARAWVSLVPSVKEGWGLVIVEAALHQTPSVAFAAAGGVRESIVHRETGFLAEDPVEFTHHVRRLLEDEALREELGRNAEKHARSFDWEPSRQRFADVVTSQL